MNGESMKQEWCERLTAALTDGRFLEDPNHWRAHVAVCSTCRASVEGYFLLRGWIKGARSEVVGMPVPALEGEAVVGRALERVKERRRRRIGLGAVAGLILIGTVAAATLRPRTCCETQAQSDPVVYAKSLWDPVFDRNGQPDFELLKKSEETRRKYVEALDHPSSVVRRTALTALTFSQIEIDPKRLEEVLGTWNEDLESPVVMASAGEAGHVLATALDLRRTATLQATIEGAWLQAARGGGVVNPKVLLPFLTHPEAEVRAGTLRALAEDPGFVPDEAVVRTFTRDEAVEVRIAAGECLIKRLGESGVARVAALLTAKPDYGAEQMLSGHLVKHEVGRELGNRRVADEATPIALALSYALSAAAHGDKEIPPALVERGLASEDPFAFGMLASVCHGLDLVQDRARLQARWRELLPGWRETARPILIGNAVAPLLRWDEASGDPARLRLGLELCEDFPTDPPRSVRRYAERVAKSTGAGEASRAATLLEKWR